MAITSNMVVPMGPEKSLSAITSTQNTHGISPPECMENMASPLRIQASWQER